MTPRLSVVIPTYQRCDIVVNTVRSFESQIDPPLFEVIVSVDGSNDGTRQTLERLETSLEPSPTFLAAHFGTHCAGADVVVGPMPLHPDSPSNLLSKGVGIWAEEYAKAVSEPGHRFRFTEIFGGHLSMPATCEPTDAPDAAEELFSRHDDSAAERWSQEAQDIGRRGWNKLRRTAQARHL
jgi:glycosyltransferase involved in cell wall biosynthesis